MAFKTPHIGLYGPKTRALQERISYEHLSLTWKDALVYKYLGSRTNTNPNINDIQDTILMTTADRAYDPTPVKVNVWYEQFGDQQMDFSRFGMINPMGDDHTFRFHTYSFNSQGLGRYIMVGDVFEIPFLNQDGNKSYFQVNDVNRKQEFENFTVTVMASVLEDREETAEIQNKNTDENVLNQLDTEIAAEQDSEVPYEGVYGDVTVQNEPSPPTPYDPRPEYDRDFLDDPNAKNF